MTLAEMQALLAALLGMRFGGVRSITYDGRLRPRAADCSH
jgi:hypothetical protein